MFGSKSDEKLAQRLQAIKFATPIKMADMVPIVERVAARKSVYKFGMVVDAGGSEIKCIVNNLSSTGAKLSLEGAIVLSEAFDLAIDGYAAPMPAKLIWQDGSNAGIQFL